MGKKTTEGTRAWSAEVGGFPFVIAFFHDLSPLAASTASKSAAKRPQIASRACRSITARFCRAASSICAPGFAIRVVKCNIMMRKRGPEVPRAEVDPS